MASVQRDRRFGHRTRRSLNVTRVNLPAPVDSCSMRCATRCLRGDAPLHGQKTADRLDDGCHCCCTKRPCIEGVDGVICPC
ncbi:hypothetical protein V8C43DRAFT_282995 [Trichoderma afarasin]